MSVDTPQPDVDSDGDSPRRSHNAPEGREGASPSPPIPPTETLRDTPARLPKRIGHYHIKRVLAAGGMGTVYEATQEKPRRTVALKLMKQGIASRSALRRFEYESQILARLRHPGIAQVYEAGTHRDDSGTVPFFAMEYIVGGEPITKYAKEKKLGTRERMTLFAQVCDAIHHGHQKGIIHRDLKPSNILVDATGQVKIIDFGVARSTDSDLAVTTLQTDIGQLIGTLQYMSPEQCKADPHDIDTRSDVYALGVVFYELLCGRLPYNVTRMAMHEATRIIREEQPTKLTTVDKTLKGDIETIALKAVEKDRERRYQSATDFAQDIRRYLGNEAIIARPLSMMYQFHVLVRRNKPIFAAIAAVFAVLVGGVIVSTSMYVRSEANRSKAEREATKAETMLGFLEGMFQSVDPYEGGAPDIKSMLDRAAQRIRAGELAGQPEIEASVLHILGSTYSGLTFNDASLSHMTRALDIRRQVLGEDHPETLRSAWAYGTLLRDQTDYRSAEAHLRNVLDAQVRVLGQEHQNTLETAVSLGSALQYQGRFREAEAMYRQITERARRKLGAKHRLTLQATFRLASALSDQGEFAEAERLSRGILETRRRTLGNENVYTLWSMANLGLVLVEQGKLAEAERVLRDGIEVSRRRFGDEQLISFALLECLGVVRRKQGNWDEAERLFEQALELSLRVLGERHRNSLDVMGNLAQVRRKQGRLVEAEALRRRQLGLRREILGEEHPKTLFSLNELAAIILCQERADEGRTYFTELIERWLGRAGHAGANPSDLHGYARLLLTCELEDLRDPEAALPFAKRAVEKSGGEDSRILDTLALAYFMTGETAKAIETQGKAVALLPPEKSPLRTELEANLAKYRTALSEQESAGPTDQEQAVPTATDDDSSKTPGDPPGAGV